jgi:dihydroorotase
VLEGGEGVRARVARAHVGSGRGVGDELVGGEAERGNARIDVGVDISILELVEGPVDFVDTRKNARKGDKYLKPVATVRAGRPFGRPYPSPFSYP